MSTETQDYQVSLDLCPYEARLEDSTITLYGTLMDVRVPERWTNLPGGEYDLLGSYSREDEDGDEDSVNVYMHHVDTHTDEDGNERFDVSLSVYSVEDFNEADVDAMLNVLDTQTVAIDEIGWEALYQSE